MSGMGVWEVKVIEMGCWCPLTSAGEESAGEEGCSSAGSGHVFILQWQLSGWNYDPNMCLCLETEQEDRFNLKKLKT